MRGGLVLNNDIKHELEYYLSMLEAGIEDFTEFDDVESLVNQSISVRDKIKDLIKRN